MTQTTTGPWASPGAGAKNTQDQSTRWCPRCGKAAHAILPHSVCGYRLPRDPEWDRLFEDAPDTDYLKKLRASLVDTQGLDEIPDPIPLIGEDILFLDSLAWMVGKPGHGKSFVALDMAACVGTGQLWHDDYPVHQGNVLFLVAEGVRGTKKRVRAWEAANGQSMKGVQFLPVAVQAGVPSNWDALVTVTEEVAPSFVVIDTQARVTVGMEENSNTAMGTFVDQAERLRRATGACVLIVHHIGRNGDTGRGATTLDGAMGTIIKVSKEKGEDEITLECQKNKDAAEWDNIHFRTVSRGESIVLVRGDGASSNRGSVLNAKWVQEWWQSRRSEPVSVTALEKDKIVSSSTFHRLKWPLLDSGLMAKIGEGNSTRYRLTRDPNPSPSPT